MRRVPRPVRGTSGWAKYARKHPERAAFYASAEWRGVRARHLRDHPNCVVCNEPATHVDHIRPRAEYGADIDPSNLQSMCAKHHHAKTVQESHRGMKRAAQRRKKT
jgi:5-methylcytosine-specific restriction endonuclease McrA